MSDFNQHSYFSQEPFPDAEELLKNWSKGQTIAKNNKTDIVDMKQREEWADRIRDIMNLLVYPKEDDINDAYEYLADLYQDLLNY